MLIIEHYDRDFRSPFSINQSFNVFSVLVILFCFHASRARRCMRKLSISTISRAKTNPTYAVHTIRNLSPVTDAPILSFSRVLCTGLFLLPNLYQLEQFSFPFGPIATSAHHNTSAQGCAMPAPFHCILPIWYFKAPEKSHYELIFTVD